MQRRDILTGVAMTAAIPLAMKTLSSTQAATPSSPDKAIDVEGGVALVTGSNRGIGLGFVKVLLERGAKRVYATGRKLENLPDVVALDPERVVPLILDVNNEDQRRAAAEAATDVTWLINNAGTPGSSVATERRVLSSETLENCRFVMETNCWSPAELTRLFTPIILKNGGGAITNIISVGAWFCLPEYSSYSMSKAAAAMMTAGVRAELDRDPVLVSGVFTGGVATRMSPPGYDPGVSPVDHAHEVFDAVARGETTIYAGAGSRELLEKIQADPEAFERDAIKRFYESPITSRVHVKGADE